MGLQLQRALAVVWRTKSYVLYRAGVYGLLCLCILGYIALLFLVNHVFGTGAFWALCGISLALIIVLGISGFIGEYVFYRSKAGHIALITEIISEGHPPLGISQIKWAKGNVLHYFEGVDPLPQVRQSLRATIRAINRSLFDPASALPLPYVEFGTKFAQRLVDFSQTYIEEGALAYTFRTKDENMFDAAKTSLVIYAQAWKPVLSNAVTLTIMSYCFILLMAVVYLIPLGFLATLLPEESNLKFVLFILGFFFAFATKWTIFDPVACASIALTFLDEGDLYDPETEWEEKIQAISESFAELKLRADEKAGLVKAKRAARRARVRRTVAAAAAEPAQAAKE